MHKLDNNAHLVFLLYYHLIMVTTGGAPIEVIREYIESQGEKKRE